MRETWVRSLGWEDPLEEGMAMYCHAPVFLSGESPWTEEPVWTIVRGFLKSRTELSD